MNTTTISGSVKEKPKPMMKRKRKKKSKIYFGTPVQNAIIRYNDNVEKPSIQNKIYNGIANIGRRPTVNDRGVLLEVNIFDFNNNIYGKEISVNLLNFIRKEKKFDGIESLKTQIKNDVRLSKEFFNLQ